MHSPLPPDWVDRLFGRLAVRYGSAWLRLWEGIDMAAVKADWGQQLAGMHAPEHQHMLRFGVDHLPPVHPPTASQFRAICVLAPEYAKQLALPAPELKADPAGVARVREIVSGMAQAKDPRAWVHALKARQDNGERLSLPQRAAVSEVLGMATAMEAG